MIRVFKKTSDRRKEEMFVNEWKPESRNFRKQEVRETTYSVTIVGNEKLFQIQTYGTEGSTASAKQTIQFDRERAVELVEILKREFGL